MLLTRAQAAQEEINGNAEHNEPTPEGQVRSPFEAELFAMVQEQRDLLEEYKDRLDGKVFDTKFGFATRIDGWSLLFTNCVIG